MTSGQLIVVVVATFGAALVQMVAGFGFALLAMPIVTLAVPVDRSVVIVSVLSVASTTWQALELRRGADATLVRRLSVGGLVGMPVGLVVLELASDRTLRIGLGVSVLVATALLVRRISLAHVGPTLDWSAGFVSGVLNTSLSTNGPPLVFDLQARGFDADRFRATIACVFAISNIGSIVAFSVAGKMSGDVLSSAAWAVPGWAAGLALGMRLRPHVYGERFRRLVLGLLMLVGVTTIVAALT